MPIMHRLPMGWITGIAAGLLCSLTTLAHAQPLPFYDNFDDGNYAGWTVTDDVEPQYGPSRWVVENGVLVQKSNIWSYLTRSVGNKVPSGYAHHYR